ncbi:lysylphosphatidylglycerol synthase domain-containing protein [Saccharicrinis fermentans]|uniref:Uncharacterized protein n=1 Tax=Saccharicrinis fermentans DSM 9555 = JCM 21142 TaxID=869213 RepID=W7Y1A0_9BACT|nr:lysylphosphatidylglycerol synthase domain-containing protein [Saccharicrinis fermentans]GAF01727.1 hypothetical protein JCM21142_341 [Saccharicrinis fermentans DSM 9555 = JCM 21142]
MGSKLTKGRWGGAVIAIASFVYIAFRLHSYGDHWDAISIQNEKLKWLPWLCLVQLFLLSLNIWFESKKWQVLLRPVIRIQSALSIKMVLAGFASGIFTPAKIGEPIGRLMFLPKKEWAKATILHYLGAVIQNVIIFVVGMAGLVLSWNYFSIHLSPATWIYILALCALVIVTLVLLFHKAWVKKALLRWGYIHKIKDLVEELGSIPLWSVAPVFLYSFLRFVVYNSQLFMLLWFLGYDSLWMGIVIIPVYFMLITVAPSFFLADIGVRGSVALFVFAELGLSDVNIVLIVTVLWLLNQVVPALLGSVMVLLKKKR